MKKTNEDPPICFESDVQAASLPPQTWEEKKPKRAEIRKKIGDLLLDIKTTEARLSFLVETQLRDLAGPPIDFKLDLRMPRWWAGGQSIAETLAELNAPPEVWRRYVAGYTDTVQ